MINGTTKSGFEFAVNENIVDDWRVARAIAKSQSADAAGQLAGAADVVALVLGEQEDALCRHICRADGSVPTETFMQEVSEIITFAREHSKAVKN